jgi:hypothetical protein
LRGARSVGIAGREPSESGFGRSNAGGIFVRGLTGGAGLTEARLMDADEEAARAFNARMAERYDAAAYTPQPEPGEMARGAVRREETVAGAVRSLAQPGFSIPVAVEAELDAEFSKLWQVGAVSPLWLGGAYATG